MRRTQLYLDDELWDALHARARHDHTTVSELMREAAREFYLGNRDQRARAMQEFIGIRKRTAQEPDAVEYVRRLRRGTRLDRLQ